MGVSGTGKTTLLKSMLAGHPEFHPAVQIIFPLLSPAEMLRMIAGELNPPSDSAGIDRMHNDQLLRNIQHTLKSHAQDGRRPMICFDDAHQLSDQVLHGVVQPLLNLSDTGEAGSFAVLLAGQPLLLSRLRKHPQISDRIGVMATLNGFDLNETITYIQTAMRSAGCDRPVFTRHAMIRLFELSGGNPRRINRLCDIALLVGFAEQLDQITAGELDAVGQELLPAAA